ncbi:hypothetical protein EAS56_26400 [Bradyrhizobium guangzhouense]|uniref:Uncharacterized protein n=1 Tax=Bradyrhizobium guangzhouense TaxID=1325095 RepID=A0ABY0E0E9_9BRAD|nr:hypothetical protein [Bradyrhizobium guangzhouense]RXH09192.1 hypothetical protein EAS56_26400 [Bradyrhizobium guangzhouense]
MSVFKTALRLAAAAALAASISTAASAAVYPPQRQLPPQVITDFKASPGTLLTQYPGGPQLISRVRDLGASDPTTLPLIIGILKDPATTKDQVRAIVAGLAQVARMAASTDQAFANEIQTAIANTGNADIIAAYQAATGDVQIAATGGGGGGGGTGAGGPTGTSGFVFGGASGTASSFGGLHSANTASSIGSGSVGSTTSSVSPH